MVPIILQRVLIILQRFFKAVRDTPQLALNSHLTPNELLFVRHRPFKPKCCNNSTPF
jgi:hypothetical protein